jgi:hypothetical protein
MAKSFMDQPLTDQKKSPFLVYYYLGILILLALVPFFYKSCYYSVFRNEVPYNDLVGVFNSIQVGMHLETVEGLLLKIPRYQEKTATNEGSRTIVYYKYYIFGKKITELGLVGTIEIELDTNGLILDKAFYPD